MNRRLNNNLRSSLVLPVGWLFADLLLALAMLFLVANTVGPKPKPTPTPIVRATPTFTPTPKPTPTPGGLLLEKDRIRLQIPNIDPDKLSQGDPGAVADLEQKIKAQVKAKGYLGRRAGIAVVYGGADDLSAAQASRGSSVADEVYKVLDMLGQQKFVFCHTVHYDSLFTTAISSTTVVIDIYFFNASVGHC